MRNQLESEGYAVCVWTDDPGTTYGPHRHDDDQIHWVVRGAIAPEIGSDEYNLRAGNPRLAAGRNRALGARCQRSGGHVSRRLEAPGIVPSSGAPLLRARQAPAAFLPPFAGAA
jgi:hypothetical protein